MTLLSSDMVLQMTPKVWWAAVALVLVAGHAAQAVRKLPEQPDKVASLSHARHVLSRAIIGGSVATNPGYRMTPQP
jgi:hypothetical protein